MKLSTFLTVMVVVSALPIAGCQDNKTPAASAVESTKDALDIREHEKLKDAGEDMKDALDNAAQGVKDETR
jgi:hypothetical protein